VVLIEATHDEARLSFVEAMLKSQRIRTRRLETPAGYPFVPTSTWNLYVFEHDAEAARRMIAEVDAAGAADPNN
jgi:hypothetical protein